MLCRGYAVIVAACALCGPGYGPLGARAFRIARAGIEAQTISSVALEGAGARSERADTAVERLRKSNSSHAARDEEHAGSERHESLHAESEHLVMRLRRALSSMVDNAKSRTHDLLSKLPSLGSPAGKGLALGGLVLGIVLCACICMRVGSLPEEGEDQRRRSRTGSRLPGPRSRARSNIGVASWISSENKLASRLSTSSSTRGSTATSSRPRAVTEGCPQRKVSFASMGMDPGPSAEVLAAAAAVAKAAREDSPEDHADEENYRLCCKELRKIARRLKGPCQKYPKHDGGDRIVGAALKNRYVAIVPSEEAPEEHVAEDDWPGQLQRWRRSRLAYWADSASCKNADPPKGHIQLMQIVKVIRDEEKTPLEVSVRYREEGGEAFALILRFPAEGEAMRWSQALIMIRHFLQQTVMGV